MPGKNIIGVYALVCLSVSMIEIEIDGFVAETFVVNLRVALLY